MNICTHERLVEGWYWYKMAMAVSLWEKGGNKSDERKIEREKTKGDGLHLL
jgi:hypothetical protein